MHHGTQNNDSESKPVGSVPYVKSLLDDYDTPVVSARYCETRTSDICYVTGAISIIILTLDTRHGFHLKENMQEDARCDTALCIAIAEDSPPSLTILHFVSVIRVMISLPQGQQDRREYNRRNLYWRRFAGSDFRRAVEAATSPIHLFSGRSSRCPFLSRCEKFLDRAGKPFY